MKHNLDLFGDPVPPNHGRRSRPAHIATRENRNKVLMLLALGWTNGRIGQRACRRRQDITQELFP
jgi:hypothetical protein